MRWRQNNDKKTGRNREHKRRSARNPEPFENIEFRLLGDWKSSAENDRYRWQASTREKKSVIVFTDQQSKALSLIGAVSATEPIALGRNEFDCCTAQWKPTNTVH